MVDQSIAYQGLHHGSSYIEHERFIDAVLAGTEPEVTIADSLLSVAMGEAAHRSIATGDPILLADVLQRRA